MVRPAVAALKIDLSPVLQGNGSPSPQSVMVSPRFCKAFRHSTDTSWAGSPKPFDAARHSDLKWSWCSTPLGRPHTLSPCTSSTRRGATAKAATGDDVLVASVPNFYEVLGLPQDVALPDIKAAYRLMARQFHPDVCPKEEAEESTRRFIAVQEAYETLSDPSRRAYYDRSFTFSFGSSGIAAKWGWDFDKEESQMGWKLHWRDQVSNLKTRSTGKAAQAPESWGSRMRRQKKQQEEQGCAYARSASFI